MLLGGVQRQSLWQGVGQRPTSEGRSARGESKNNPVNCFSRGDALQVRASPTVVPLLLARGIIPRVIAVPFERDVEDAVPYSTFAYQPVRPHIIYGQLYPKE